MTLALTDEHAQLGKISNNLEKHGDDDLVTGFTLPLAMRIPRPQLVELMGQAFDACVWQIDNSPMEWTRRVVPIELAGEVYVEAESQLILGEDQAELTFEGCRISHVTLQGFDAGGITRVGCHLYVRPGIGQKNLLLQEYQGQEIAVQITSGKLRVKADKAQRDLPLEEPKSERQAAFDRGEKVEIITTTIDGIITHDHPSFNGGKISHPQSLQCLVCRGELESVVKLPDGTEVTSIVERDPGPSDEPLRTEQTIAAELQSSHDEDDEPRMSRMGRQISAHAEKAES